MSSTAIIAILTRARVYPFMEDNAGWHGKAPSDEVAAAIEGAWGDN